MWGGGGGNLVKLDEILQICASFCFMGEQKTNVVTSHKCVNNFPQVKGIEGDISIGEFHLHLSCIGGNAIIAHSCGKGRNFLVLMPQ